ncbi:MAG: GNAT family N-acetyltransferase [Pseudomonadota bacterium]
MSRGSRDVTPAGAILTAPSARFAASFAEALAEGFRRGNRAAASTAEIRRARGDFRAYRAQRLEQAARIVLPDGRRVPPVPVSLHWLVAGEEFLGELSFRHRLCPELRLSGGHMGYGIRPSRRGRGFAKRLLALGLDLARAKGLPQALLTCHDDNRASARVIEANGGVLEDVIDDIFGGGPLRRYWIDLGGAGA